MSLGTPPQHDNVLEIVDCADCNRLHIEIRRPTLLNVGHRDEGNAVFIGARCQVTLLPHENEAGVCAPRRTRRIEPAAVVREADHDLRPFVLRFNMDRAVLLLARDRPRDLVFNPVVDRVAQQMLERPDRTC